jgi:hypothetical protein
VDCWWNLGVVRSLMFKSTSTDYPGELQMLVGNRGSGETLKKKQNGSKSIRVPVLQVKNANKSYHSSLILTCHGNDLHTSLVRPNKTPSGKPPRGGYMDPACITSGCRPAFHEPHARFPKPRVQIPLSRKISSDFNCGLAIWAVGSLPRHPDWGPQSGTARGS